MKNLKTFVQHCVLITAVIVLIFAGFGIGSVAASTNELTAASDTIASGGYVTITLQAPYGEWYVGVDKNAVIPRNQVNMTGILDIDGHYITNQQTNTEDYRQARIHVDSSNRAEFIVKAYTGNDFTVMLYANNWNATVEDEVTINVVGEVAITANVDTDCVYIGDKFEISGTNNLGGNLIFYIKGTNYPLSFYGNTTTGEAYATGSGTEWSAMIDTTKLRYPDAGVYTIYVAKVHPGFDDYYKTYYDYYYSSQRLETDDFDNLSKFDAYTTVQLSLIQPYVAVSANIEQDSSQNKILSITGTATGSPKNLQVYVLGTNFFAFDNISVSDDASYRFEKKIVGTGISDSNAWQMDDGEYIVVVQHPMIDGVFNVAPLSDNNGGYNIYYNEGGQNTGPGDVYTRSDNTFVFNTNSYPLSLAADVLLKTLDSQNIDDLERHVSINVLGNTISTPLKISESIAVEPEKDSVCLGDEFEISGTNNLGGNLIFYVKGTNYPLTFYGNTATGEAYATGSGTQWTATIDTGKLLNPDVGTYTIFAAKVHAGFTNYPSVTQISDLNTESMFDGYNITTVTFLEPSISVNIKDDVVIQGDKLEVTGSAKGSPSRVKIYVFGTNFFEFDSAPVSDDGTYTFTKKVVASDKEETGAWSMCTGLFYLVVQHPMYDEVFNIGPLVSSSGGYDIRLNEMGSYTDGGIIIFNTLSRQSSNAAQALIDAIGTPSIDDIQAHKSFIVAGLFSYVNAVPSQVTKGYALTVSGTTAGHKNEVVTVELLSTAFENIPKETVGPSAFATMSTTIGDDGVWSVTFDTSALDTGNYTVSIAVGKLDPVTSNIMIVTEGESVTPTVPPTPTIDESNEYYVNPTGTLETGDKVTASMTVSYPDGSVIPTQLNLDSDLVGVSWTVVKNPGAANEMTCHPVYPYDCILNFDIYESSGSVILRITVNGTVSSESAGKSIVPLTLTETRGSGRVLIAPSQYVNGTVSPGRPEVTGNLKLNAGWNFISVPKKLSADYDTAGEFFADVDTGGYSILMYNAETKEWELVPSSTKISPLNAYWIYSVSEIELPSAFDTTPSLLPTKSVYKGWNAVGLCAEDAMEAQAAFGNTNWYSFVVWDSVKQKYATPIIKGNTGIYADTNLVSLWTGGWLFLNEDGTYMGFTA